MSGILFVVATPIGNLGDITLRAIETLKNVDLIVCEDTRHSKRLLQHIAVSKPLLHYDEHNHKRVSPQLLRQLKEGRKMALISDAGTPSVSDPGNRLVEEALREGLSVIPIPGASAVTAAVSVSGWVSEGYTFLGFLPPRKGRALRLLQDTLAQGRIVVLYESPYRVESTLGLIEKADNEACVLVAREMTKLHEEFIKGDIQDVKKKINGRSLKGEFVIVIQPKER